MNNSVWTQLTVHFRALNQMWQSDGLRSRFYNQRLTSVLYTSLYLISIILANFSVAWFGRKAVIVNAILFIGLDLTARDKLHDEWKKDKLVVKMSLLVLSGSLLSWLLNRTAGQIAVASFMAFALAGVADTIAYHLMRNKVSFVRVNGSNIASALVDSVVFTILAFGAFMPGIIAGQFVAKVFGGALYSVLFRIGGNNDD